MSHDIFGIIAVQHTQQNYRTLAIGVALVMTMVFAAKTAFSAGISDRGKPDAILGGGPILSGSAPGPCEPELDQAELVGGTDADGKPVAPADLATGPIPLTGQIAVPLKARRGRAPAYVTVDGAKLDPLFNPPSCH